MKYMQGIKLLQQCQEVKGYMNSCCGKSISWQNTSYMAFFIVVYIIFYFKETLNVDSTSALTTTQLEYTSHKGDLTTWNSLSIDAMKGLKTILCVNKILTKSQ